MRKAWLSESNQVNTLFVIHNITIWDALCVTCVRLTCEIGDDETCNE